MLFSGIQLHSNIGVEQLDLGKISLIISQDTTRFTRLDYTREKYLWIMKRGFAAKMIVDEQLSEAETSSSACG